MRMLAWGWIGILCSLAGCGSQEYASTPETKTKVKASAKECSADDCCSSVTRAGLLKQSLEKKDDTEELQSK